MGREKQGWWWENWAAVEGKLSWDKGGETFLFSCGNMGKSECCPGCTRGHCREEGQETLRQHSWAAKWTAILTTTIIHCHQSAKNVTFKVPRNAVKSYWKVQYVSPSRAESKMKLFGSFSVYRRCRDPWRVNFGSLCSRGSFRMW